MGKRGKKYLQAVQKLSKRPYLLKEAIEAIKKVAYANFDETLEIAMKLGVNPVYADQMVRGSVVLPHGTGKSKKVLVFAKGEKVKEAKEAGADYVGGEEFADKIAKENWLDFDAVVATPDMMRIVGKLGKILGPRGLMPNPKTGTVTFEVAKAVDEIKKGKVNFRVDKAGNVHAPVGKLSFSDDKLEENVRTFIDAVLKAKPSGVKGSYVLNVSLASTMGPGVEIDKSEVKQLSE